MPVFCGLSGNGSARSSTAERFLNLTRILPPCDGCWRTFTRPAGHRKRRLASACVALNFPGALPFLLLDLGDSYAAAGKRDEALRIIEELHQLSKHRYVMAYWMALIYAGLKE